MRLWQHWILYGNGKGMWLVFPMSSLIETTIHALYWRLDFDEPNWPIIISLKDSQLMFIIQIYYPQEQENIHPTSQTWSSMLSITTPLCLLIIIAISPFPNSMYFDMSLPLNLRTLSITFSTTTLMWPCLSLEPRVLFHNNKWHSSNLHFFYCCCNFFYPSTFLTSLNIVFRCLHGELDNILFIKVFFSFEMYLIYVIPRKDDDILKIFHGTK